MIISFVSFVIVLAIIDGGAPPVRDGQPSGGDDCGPEPGRDDCGPINPVVLSKSFLVRWKFQLTLCPKKVNFS